MVTYKHLSLQVAILFLVTHAVPSAAHNKTKNSTNSLPLSPPPFNSQGGCDYSKAFRSVFAFGDSNTDPGNALLMGSLTFKLHPGIHKSGNPFCDGKLLIDYVCDTLGIPPVPPFQNSTGDFSHGANFALAGTSCFTNVQRIHSSIHALLGKVIPGAINLQLSWYQKYLQAIAASSGSQVQGGGSHGSSGSRNTQGSVSFTGGGAGSGGGFSFGGGGNDGSGGMGNSKSGGGFSFGGGGNDGSGGMSNSKSGAGLSFGGGGNDGSGGTGNSKSGGFSQWGSGGSGSSGSSKDGFSYGSSSVNGGGRSGFSFDGTGSSSYGGQSGSGSSSIGGSQRGSVSGSGSVSGGGSSSGSGGSSISKALEDVLFWVGPIGGNDYARMYSSHNSGVTSQWISQQTINQVTKLVTTLLETGAKYIVVQGLPPVGCFPATLSSTPSSDRDEHGCSASANAAVASHNDEIQQFLALLQKTFVDCTIVFADFYKAYMTVITSPEMYHIIDAFSTCCGPKGGLLNFDPQHPCGAATTAACQKAAEHVIWDGIHLTAQMNKYVAKMFLNQTGYTQPCLIDVVNKKLSSS